MYYMCITQIEQAFIYWSSLPYPPNIPRLGALHCPKATPLYFGYIYYHVDRYEINFAPSVLL